MSTETVTHRAGLTDLELADRMEVCWEYHRVLLVSAIEHAAKRGLAPRRWSAWTIPRDKKDWPSRPSLRTGCSRAAPLGYRGTSRVPNRRGQAQGRVLCRQRRWRCWPIHADPAVPAAARLDFAGGFAG